MSQKDNMDSSEHHNAVLQDVVIEVENDNDYDQEDEDINQSGDEDQNEYHD